MMSIAYIFIVLSNNIVVIQCKRDCFFIDIKEILSLLKIIYHDVGLDLFREMIFFQKIDGLIEIFTEMNEVEY